MPHSYYREWSYLFYYEALSAVMSSEVNDVDAYRALAAAISAGDAAGAADTARELLGHATQALLHALDQLEGGRP